jgi:hypothetical protein
MAFTVEDFEDLIKLLAQHPEWRTELRRHVLSDDLIELPSLVRQLVESQARSESRMERVEGRLGGLESRMDRVEATLERLAEAQARSESRLEGVEAALARLAEAPARTAVAVTDLTIWSGRTENRLGEMDGKLLELDFDRKGPAYLAPIARRLRVVPFGPLADLLDEAIDEGRMADDDRAAIMNTDAVLSGRRRADGQDIYLVVEVSGGIAMHDVERAIERAALLEKLGRPVVPVVAGRRINDEVALLAYERGVWTALGGLLNPPRSGH